MCININSSMGSTIVWVCNMKQESEVKLYSHHLLASCLTPLSLILHVHKTGEIIIFLSHMVVPICHCRRHGFSSWVCKLFWRRNNPDQFLPGKSHGCLVGYSSWGHREPDVTEQAQEEENLLPCARYHAHRA